MSLQEQGETRPKRSASEWVAFAIATALLLVVVGAVTRLWVTDQNRPARLEAVISGPVRVEGGAHYVLVHVTNRGDRTAESVQVIAELSNGKETIEDGEQTIDFLSGGDVTEVQFVFTQDPGSAELTVRAASYTNP